MRQVEGTQLGVHLPEVGDGRHDAGLQRLHRDDIFQADTHRVAGDALGVGDDDAVGTCAEHPAQSVYLRSSRTTTRRRVGLVGHEDQFACHRGAIRASYFALTHHCFHDPADVLHIQPGAMERTVRGDGTEHLADRLDTALARRTGALHDQRGRAHAQDHAVPALVERQRRLRHVLVGGRGARREEPCAEPAQQVVARRIVGGDDDHPPAAAGADPVLGERDRLRGARARGVDLGVGAAGPDQLGELRVPHREHTEQEPAVEQVRVHLELVLHVVNATVDLRHGTAGRVGLGHAGTHGLQLVELQPAGSVLLVAAHLVGELLEPGEGAGEDDTGLVAQRVGQAPTLGQLGTQVGGLVALHERDAGVAQCVEPGGDRQLCGASQRRQAVSLHPELGGEVERAGAAGQLDHVGDAVDRFEAGTPRLALGEPHDVLVEDLVAQPGGNDVDQLLTVQQTGEVLVVEHPLGARGAEGGAGDDHRLGADSGGSLADPHQRSGFVEEVVEECPQVGLHSTAHFHGIGRRRCHRGGGGGGSRRRGSGTRRRIARGAVAGCIEAAQGLVEGHHIGLLGMVAEQDCDVVAQHVGCEPVQGPLRPHLQEHPRAGVVQRVQALDELHRRGDLLCQQVEHRLGHAVAHRVELAGHVGDDRPYRRVQVQPLQCAPQRLAGGRDDAGVERVAHRQAGGQPAPRLARGQRCLHGDGGAADHRLRVRVDVGEHDIAVDAVDQQLHLVDRGEHGGHHAVVLDGQAGHLVPAGAHRLQRRGERQRPSCDEGAVLAQAVTDHHVGLDAVRGEQGGEREVGGQHRRLCDLGVAQVFLGAVHRRRIVGVDEDEVAQRFAEQRRHHPVGLHEPFGHDRFGRSQPAEHVHVLRALAGVHECDRGGRACAAEHPTTSQHRPHRRRLERRQCPGGLVGQLCRVAVVDCQPLGCGQRRGRRRLRRRGRTGCRGGQHVAQLLDQPGFGGGAEHERTPQRGFRRRHRGRQRGCRRSNGGCEIGAHRHHLRRVHAQTPGYVLFEHHMEVGATEPERTDPRGAHTSACGRRPLAQLGVHAERRGRPIDVRVRVGEVQARRQHLVVQCQGGLQDAGSTGSGLQVADVRLRRAQRHRARGQPGAGEHLTETGHLHHVADTCARAVRFHQTAHRGRKPGRRPRAGHRQALTHRVRRGDALALAVARTGDAAQHRIDTITGALRVGQPLQQEQRSTLAHHEAVGTCVERAGTRCRECADLAELHETGGAHVAVDAAGDHRVELVLDEPLDRRVDGGHGRRAGGVDDEVGPVEVEQVGHPTGDHVAQLTGHRVLGDLGVVHAHADAELVDDRRTHLCRKLLERRRAEQLANDLRGRDTQCGQVVVLTGHRVAQDDRGALVVDRLAMVGQHRPGAGDGPLLAIVDRLAHLRRDRQLPRQRVPLPVADPAADLRVRLVGCSVVFVVVQGRVPAAGQHLADRVATAGDVVPVGRSIGRVGQDCRNAHDCHWFHDGCPFVRPGYGPGRVVSLVSRGRRGRRRWCPCRRVDRTGRRGFGAAPPLPADGRRRHRRRRRG